MDETSLKKDSQSRKFQLTINNPDDKCITGELIGQLLQSLKGLVYYCYSKEVGAEGTPHYHIFVIFVNPKRFSTIKNLFPSAHIEATKGSNRDNVDYVFKAGKWSGTEKESTRIDGTQAEFGELPPDRSSSNSELAQLYELIADGKSNYEILQEYPEYLRDISTIDRARRIIQQEYFKNTWRDLTVTYIFGRTGAGKSRSVMEEYGYSNVFRVTDYQHPFDTYEGQDVIMFEEYSSSFKINDMLNYLDGYPLKLPARYSDKTACFTKAYILTNIPLEEQYPSVQDEKPEVWKAFLRRIHKVVWYQPDGGKVEFSSVADYLNRSEPFRKLAPSETTPFEQKGKYRQVRLFSRNGFPRP